MSNDIHTIELLPEEVEVSEISESSNQILIRRKVSCVIPELDIPEVDKQASMSRAESDGGSESEVSEHDYSSDDDGLIPGERIGSYTIDEWYDFVCSPEFVSRFGSGGSQETDGQCMECLDRTE